MKHYTFVLVSEGRLPLLMHGVGNSLFSVCRKLLGTDGLKSMYAEGWTIADYYWLA